MDITWISEKSIANSEEFTTHQIRFNKDKTFSYIIDNDEENKYLTCESYKYKKSTKKIILKCAEQTKSIKIKEISKEKLVLEFDDETLTFHLPEE